MSKIRTRFSLPDGFFAFDLKDTLRLGVWIIISVFALGGLWAQQKQEIQKIDEAGKMRDAAIVELKTRLTKVDDTLTKRMEIDAALAATLEGIRTELRYVNEKIDTLRKDSRPGR